MAVYPGALKAFDRRRDLTQVAFARHFNDLQDEITAIQTTIGTGILSSPKTNGATTAYASLADRLTKRNMAPTVIEAFADAPYTYTSGSTPSIVWNSVRTTTNGVATDVANVTSLTLPAASGYLTSLAASGVAPTSGTVNLQFIGTRIVQTPHTGMTTVVAGYHIGTETTSTDYTAYTGDSGGYPPPVIVYPGGSGWEYTGHWGSIGSSGTVHWTEYFTRTGAITDYATGPYTYYTTDTVTSTVRSISQSVTAGAPFALATNDAAITNADGSTSPVCTSLTVSGGVIPPKLRLTVVCL